MKRMIKASMSNRRMYKVEVTWHDGTFNPTETYDIEASSDQEAVVDALECAKSDLSIESIYKVDEDKWEALIDFAYQGVEWLFYNIEGTLEDEAIENAINDAAFYLSAKVLFSYDKDEI